MHRKLWARLLSCVLALSVVLAAVPKPAQAVYYVVGDGGSYALMEYFRHRWPDAGYKIWTDYPQEFRAIISNGGNAFTNYSQRWVGMDYLIGKYGVQEPEDMGTNSAEVLAQLNAARQAFDDAWAQYQETNKPYQPGGIGGGSGDSGGGDEPSGPTVSGDYLVVNPQVITPKLNSYNPNLPTTDLMFNKSPFVPSDVKVALPVSKFTSVPDGTYKFWVQLHPTTEKNIGNLWVILIPSSVSYNESTGTYTDAITEQQGSYIKLDNIQSGYYSYSTSYNTSNVNNRLSYSDNTLYDLYTTRFNQQNSSTNTYAMTYGGLIYYGDITLPLGSGGGTGGTVNPVPDPSTIEKPESPVTPSNPQTPERDSPTIVIGGTTQTVPDTSPAPDLSTIEDLLRRILANTNTIIEQMNSFASQLGQELADFYDAVYDWFGVIDTRLRDQIALLDSQVSWLETLYDWAQSIDSDIQYLQSVCQNGFNDVTAWLRNIFNRMVQGNGGGSKPGIVDPTDPSPVMDWLRQLWTSFLADLQMVLPNQVGAVVDFLDQLRQKFPFSIPWDIAAMLALLNHAPVTPVVDIPWGYAGGIEYVHVDCHAWDDAVEIVRPMFLLLFALGLALLTRELLAGLEAVL